jgi:hypothetical protein
VIDRGTVRRSFHVEARNISLHHLNILAQRPLRETLLGKVKLMQRPLRETLMRSEKCKVDATSPAGDVAEKRER